MNESLISKRPLPAKRSTDVFQFLCATTQRHGAEQPTLEKEQMQNKKENAFPLKFHKSRAQRAQLKFLTSSFGPVT